MIWDRRLIGQVTALRVSRRLADEVAAEPGAEAALRELLAQDFAHHAEPLGVVVHPADLAFHTEDEPTTGSATVTAAWRPSTHDIELVGGHIDGHVLAFNRVGEPYRVPLPSDLSALVAASQDTRPDAMVQIATYDLSGWSESSRHWLYTSTT